MSRTLRADAHVLDLACGTGDLAFAAARYAARGAVLAVDASPAMIDIARTRAKTEAPGAPIQFADPARREGFVTAWRIPLELCGQRDCGVRIWLTGMRRCV
jgi:SAM-dependent methyltransferase